jgi:hypothetical protein
MALSSGANTDVAIVGTALGWHWRSGLRILSLGWVFELYGNKYQNRTFVFQDIHVYEVQRLESNTASDHLWNGE